MKCLILILVLMTSAQAQHHHGDKPSVHGMVIFGKTSVYLSHLPMFHTPHDYQAIMEVEIDSPAKAFYIEAMKSEKLFTLVPEKFSLPEMMAKPRPFKAEIFAGHFERGGKLLASTTVKIKKILLFKKLNPNGQRPAQSTYYSFGNGTEQFLVHKISSRPDFDHIIATIHGDPAFQEKKFSFPDTQPAVDGEEIYFETGDLSH